MENKKRDILNEIKNKGHGFVSPKSYFSEFESSFYQATNKKSTGFIDPEGYFDNLEDRILSNAASSDHANKTGFTVPDDYFEQLELKLLKAKNTKVIRFNKYKNLKIIGLSIAASLLLFFGLNNFRSHKDQFDMQTVSITEIESWLDDDLISLSDYDIAETFSDTELSYYEYENDEITDYLNFVDIENLILEN